MTAETFVPESTDRIADARRRRAADVAGPRGPVSFVWGDFVTEPGTRVEGASGEWAPLPDGTAGLVVTASGAEGIEIGGVLVDGTAVLHHRATDGPAVARFADGAEGVIFTYDGSKYALQVWNPRSEWAQRFGGISAYDEDPGWVLEAEVTLIDSDRTVAISHHRDPRPVDVPVVAEVRFHRDGRDHVLIGTAGGPDSDGILLLFTDATSGTETYAAGRVLRIPERRAGAIALDFNRTQLLPCAFSLAWNCPIPPRENALGIAVRAGEKHALDTDGGNLL